MSHRLSGVNGLKRVGPACLFLVVCFFSLWRLDRPFLWNDEGDTVFLGRAIGRYGVPKATDGRNVYSFYNCVQYDKDLNSKRIPWVQYYVSYISEKIFGDSTAGARTLFALLGALCFWPLGLLLKRYPFGWIVATALLLFPQTILFNRNARYFSLLNFEAISLLWLVFVAKASRMRTLAVSGLSVLTFFTHPLAAIQLTGAFTVYFFIRERREMLKNIASLWVGFPLWLAWHESTEGFRSVFAFSPVSHNFSLATMFQLDVIFGNLSAGFSDLDFIGCFQATSWILIGAALYYLRRQRKSLEPLALFILLYSVFSLVSISVVLVVSNEVSKNFPLRYIPPVCFLLPLLSYLFVQNLKTKRAFKFTLFFILFFTNFLSFGYWTKGSPWSWWAPVYKEIFFGAPDNVKIAIEEIKKLDLPQDALIEVLPPMVEPNFLVYLGDRLLLKPYFRALSPDCRAALENTVGLGQFRRFTKLPKVTLMFPNQFSPPPVRLDERQMKERYSVKMHTTQFDGSRPELNRHQFWQNDTEASFEFIRY